MNPHARRLLRAEGALQPRFFSANQCSVITRNMVPNPPHIPIAQGADHTRRPISITCPLSLASIISISMSMSCSWS